MTTRSVAVIGLGAIGGSIAWRAVRRGVPRVIGFAPSAVERDAALRAGAITEAVDSPEAALREADFLVLAAPPLAVLHLLSALAPIIRCVGIPCTDTVSVKQPVLEAAARAGLDAWFVGGHPLAGTHQSGFGAATPELLRDAVVYLTPTRDGGASTDAVLRFWRDALGTRPMLVDAGEHDRKLAWISHLPQAVASTLAVALARSGGDLATCGPGARDTTRLAQSNPDLWREILLLNRETVLEALTGMEEALGGLRAALAKGDADALGQWLEEGARWRSER